MDLNKRHDKRDDVILHYGGDQLETRSGGHGNIPDRVLLVLVFVLFEQLLQKERHQILLQRGFDEMVSHDCGVSL